jgi:hypothetical protein
MASCHDGCSNHCPCTSRVCIFRELQSTSDDFYLIVCQRVSEGALLTQCTLDPVVMGIMADLSHLNGHHAAHSGANSADMSIKYHLIHRVCMLLRTDVSVCALRAGVRHHSLSLTSVSDN